MERKKETLYLSAYHFNRARILTKLKELTDAMGASVISSAWFMDTDYHFINRGIEDIKTDCMASIGKSIRYLETHKDPEKTKEVKANIEKNEAKIKSLSTALPYFDTTIKSYYQFFLDGIYYYIQLDDNPFFEHYFHKIELDENNSYRGRYYIDDIGDKWFNDDIWKCTCSQEAIDNAAKSLLDSLLSKPCSQQCFTKHKVHDYYTENGKDVFHYENIPDDQDRVVKFVIGTKGGKEC